MNVDTLVVFEGKRGSAGSLFETLLAIHTLCPKKVFIFSDPDYFFFNRSNSGSLKSGIQKVCLDKKIEIDSISMKPDNYHFKSDVKEPNFPRNSVFLVANGISRLSNMTLINCLADIVDPLDKRLMVFDIATRSFFINRKDDLPYQLCVFEGANLSPDNSLIVFQQTLFAALKQNEGTVIFPPFISSLASLIKEEGYFPRYRYPLFFKKETIAYLDIWIDKPNLCYKIQKNQEMREITSHLVSQTLNRLDNKGLWDVIVS